MWLLLKCLLKQFFCLLSLVKSQESSAAQRKDFGGRVIAGKRLRIVEKLLKLAEAKHGLP